MSPDPTAVLDPAGREALGRVLELLAEERASVSSVVDERAWKVHVADSLTGLEVPELASRPADRRRRRRRGLSRPRPRGSPPRRPGRPDRVDRPQVRLHAARHRRGRDRQRHRPQHPLRGPRVSGRPRDLRHRHRPRRGPPLDPGRARIPAPEAKRRPHRLEGQTRRGGGAAAHQRLRVPGNAPRIDPRRRQTAPAANTATSTSSGRSAPRQPISRASPASPRSAPRAEPLGCDSS